MSGPARGSTSTIHCSQNLRPSKSSSCSTGIRKTRVPAIYSSRIQNKSCDLKKCVLGKQKQEARETNRGCTCKSSDSVKQSKTQPNIITKKEYEGYQEVTQVASKESQALPTEDEKERLMKESQARKEEFRKMDKMRPRAKNARLDEIDEEARKRTMHILDRAQSMKLEQEEEIRKCNRIILETKCRAIRDAQIAEKRLIEKELADEEKRLNDMMENERRLAIKQELKKDQQAAAKKQEFVNMLKDQILENEVQRIFEFERKQEESRLINLNNIAWQREEIAKMQTREAENARIRRDLAEGHEQLKHIKAMEEEEAKVIDRRIKEFQRLKEERDAKLAEQKRLEKLKKDKERQQVTMQVAQAQDFQAHIDEINAARAQEEVEREWRQKEKEEALKRIEAQQKLSQAREEQINNKKLMQAIELERDKREFEKIVRVQKAAFLREKEEIEKKQRQALKLRTEILKQVNEREKERIKSRQKMFDEGLAIRTEAEMRKKKLRDAMERKCQEMRNNRVPEIYINEVKRLIENVH